MKPLNSTFDFLTRVHDTRGNLTSFALAQIPFLTKRIFTVSNASPFIKRGGHAHYKCHQYLFAFNGPLSLSLHKWDKYRNAPEITNYALQDGEGVWILPLSWVEIQMDSSTVMLVFASDLYDENDYIRDYQLFLKVLKEMDTPEN